jgi:predicted ATPase
MKTIRHTVNVPGQMEQLLNQRIQDFRSLSGYFVALGFTDALYLPKRPIAKAFANASWQQQRRAVENIMTLRKHGWNGVNMQLHLDAISQVERVAVKCLKRGDWVLDHIEEELAFMRGADFRR